MKVTGKDMVGVDKGLQFLSSLDYSNQKYWLVEYRVLH